MCQTPGQEHHVPVSTMNYWMHKLKTLDGQSDTDMIFAKMPTETEIYCPFNRTQDMI